MLLDHAKNRKSSNDRKISTWKKEICERTAVVPAAAVQDFKPLLTYLRSMFTYMLQVRHEWNVQWRVGHSKEHDVFSWRT